MLKFIGLFILKKQAKSHNISLVIKIQLDRKLERESNLGSRSPLESQNYVVQIHKSIQIIKFIKHILNLDLKLMKSIYKYI